MPSVSDEPAPVASSDPSPSKVGTFVHTTGSGPAARNAKKPRTASGNSIPGVGEDGAGAAETVSKPGGILNHSPNTLRSLLAPFSASDAATANGADPSAAAAAGEDAPKVETQRDKETGGPGSGMGNSKSSQRAPAVGDGIASVIQGDTVDEEEEQERASVEAGGAVAGAVAAMTTAQAEESDRPSRRATNGSSTSAGAAAAPRRRSSNRRNASTGSSRSQQRRPSSQSPPPLPDNASAVASAAAGKMASVPSSSRVDPSIVQRIDPEITVRNAWQLLPFLAGQATNIASNFVSHHLYGPPKKSWGIEMTIFTGIVRSASAYSHLSSIERLRRMLDLGQILPTPKDGIITPVSWKVKRRGLRGFLKEADRAEDGKRELTGEWVVSKRMWKKMQADHAKRLANQQNNASSSSGKEPSSPESNSGHHHHSHPHDQPGFKRRNTGTSAHSGPDKEKEDHGMGKEKVMLYLHGGAYFVMSAASHRPLTISVAKYTECRLFAINYRLAPETKFPGALHDAVSAYFRLVYDLKIPPANIVIAGDSAGGGLTMALLMYLRDEGYPLPCGAMLMSPWSDLTMSCDSWDSNLAYDYLPMPKQDDPLNPVKCYLGEEGVRKYITHPYASPLFGDFHGLPPMLIQAGDAEVLRDEVTLVAHKASLHGVRVEHELYEDCVHVFQAFLFLEASRKALQSQRQFIRRTLPALQAEADAAKERKKAKLAKAQKTVKDATALSPGTTTDQHGAQPPSPSRLAVPVSKRFDESSEDSDASQAVPRHGHGDIRTVDAEISSDAHLVTERSQTRPESLPATPTGSSTKLPGEDELEGSSGEEMLSTPEAEREQASLGAAAVKASPPAKGSAPPPAAPAPEAAPAPAPAPAESSTSRFGLSLRGRLPPAMDISTLQSLFMSKSQPSTPAPPGTGRGGSTPQALSVADPTAVDNTSAPGSPAASPTASRHRRSQSTNPPGGLDIHRVTDRAQMAPIRARTGSHPDLQSLVDSYNTAAKTPGAASLRTTVWRQGDAPDPDGEYEDYFRPLAEQQKEPKGKTAATPDRDDEAAPRYAWESPGYGFS